jgi:5-methyltetrahydropteroyltriglutamate--homocysteine methyltransferase
MAVARDFPLFPTTLVGSFPQPQWLIHRDGLAVTRVRDRHLWRVDDEALAEAQDDATRLAVREQIDAGLDILTDGEIRRESYSNRFATALDGVDDDHPGQTLGRTGNQVPVPRVTGPISRPGPIEAGDVAFLRALTDQPIKITLPGPFTMAQQAVDDYYRDNKALATAYAAAVRDEVADLFAAGADIVQLDEPYLEARPDLARSYGVEVINAALEGAAGTTALHLCFGYAAVVKEKPGAYSFLAELADAAVDQISIETAQPKLDCSVLAKLGDKSVMVGVIDLGTEEVETPEMIVARVERALAYLPPERIILAPDCGMKFLPRDSARGKLRAMTAAAHTLRDRFA